MERIQAAISKAREAREKQPQAAQGTPPEAQQPARRQAGPSRPEAIRAAWEALPQISPAPELLSRNRIITREGGPEAAAFDVIRTRTLQQMENKEWRRLAVTSPSASCGKSTLCLNLALSLTRQREVSVVLVEMDMRRPSLGKLLKMSQRHSVAMALSEDSPIEDNAVRFGENLALMTTFGVTRNPSDILHSASVPRVLEQIERTYGPTLTIFDMPPLLVNDDALAFLHHVDCALLVAAAGATTIKEIDTCERELAEHTNVLGVVLNKCRYLGRDYSAEYYY